MEVTHLPLPLNEDEDVKGVAEDNGGMEATHPPSPFSVSEIASEDEDAGIQATPSPPPSSSLKVFPFNIKNYHLVRCGQS